MVLFRALWVLWMVWFRLGVVGGSGFGCWRGCCSFLEDYLE